MWDKRILDDLSSRRDRTISRGGSRRILSQHESGKLTARERIHLLFDLDTFVEIDSMMESRTTDFDMETKRVPGDGVVTGYGKIFGRTVFASSQDFTVNGGSLGEYQAKRICRVMDMALDMRCPFISINDSGGARIEEGIDSLSGYGEIFLRNTRASGVIPQISVIMGPCAGGACYSPAITDFVFMVRKNSFMFITGPAVIKQVTGEEVTSESLGGSDVHMKASGVAHFAYDDDATCLDGVRRLMRYLPQSCGDSLPSLPGKEMDLCRTLQEVVTDNQKKCYDARTVVGAIVDRHSFMEIQADFAMNVLVGLAFLNGRPVGIVANQPGYMSGVLDFNASDKAARFVRFCDCFGIPLITFVDVPAFLPGKTQETNGLIRHGAKLLYAYSEATVPKVTVILRKAYGGAYIAMCSKGLGADMVFAWPIAEIAVMGAEGAVSIIGKKSIQAAQNPEEERSRQIMAYSERFLNPYVAAARGFVDEVITPEETKTRIVSALEMLITKKGNFISRKHGNIPL